MVSGSACLLNSLILPFPFWICMYVSFSVSLPSAFSTICFFVFLDLCRAVFPLFVRSLAHSFVRSLPYSWILPSSVLSFIRSFVPSFVLSFHMKVKQQDRNTAHFSSAWEQRSQPTDETLLSSWLEYEVSRLLRQIHVQKYCHRSAMETPLFLVQLWRGSLQIRSG